MGKNGQFQRLLVSEFWEGFWLKSQARVWGCLSQGGQICPKNTPKNVPIYPFRVQLKQPNSFSCITTPGPWQFILAKPPFGTPFWPKVKQKCGELPLISENWTILAYFGIVWLYWLELLTHKSGSKWGLWAGTLYQTLGLWELWPL